MRPDWFVDPFLISTFIGIEYFRRTFLHQSFIIWFASSFSVNKRCVGVFGDTYAIVTHGNFLRPCHRHLDQGILIKLGCKNKMDLFSSISTANRDQNNFQSNCPHVRSNRKASNIFSFDLCQKMGSNILYLGCVFIVAFSLEEKCSNSWNACILVAGIIIHVTLNWHLIDFAANSEVICNGWNCTQIQYNYYTIIS